MDRLMAIRAAAVLAGALGLAACATHAARAAPAPAAAGRSCFYARNISNWEAVNRTTVNIRVNVNDYYQLKLLGECTNIDFAEHIGIVHRGSPWICSGLDATLIVPQVGGGPPLRCAVTSIRKLSPAEVKALPPKHKP